MTLAEHCGPVILGTKPAAMFTLPRVHVDSPALARTLAHHGLSRRVLCDRGERQLVLVYAEDRLARTLDTPAACRMLASLGYPLAGLNARLDHLQARLCGQEEFPHEIGFFLGYPQEDVLGFIRHRGQQCKHCGLWKVYGDVAEAKALFDAYHQCREQLTHHVMSGGSLCALPGR